MLARMKFAVSVSTAVLALFSVASTLAAQAVPRVLLVSPATLAAEKAHPDPQLMKLALHAAANAMKTEPQSVVNKNKVPPSGDKHDYMSLARYWWPNPDTPDHLPYVRHDGRSNPEIKGIADHQELQTMSESSNALALAWYLTGDERYAGHAALLLRTFFLAPATAMNPNMNFAQYIPGVNTGRGAGVLDSRSFPMALDAATMLAGSKAWSAADQTGLEQWFSKYYEWLNSSDLAHHEAAAPNNHGSWFNVQAAAVALFLGKDAEARHLAERVRDQRIPSQFDREGMQKYELVRTNSFSYSAFNLEALTELANIVQSTGVDLYQPVKLGAPTILTGIDALLPFDPQHPWPHEQITKDHEDSLCPALVRAAAHTHDAKYSEAQQRFHCKQTADSMLEASRP